MHIIKQSNILNLPVADLICQLNIDDGDVSTWFYREYCSLSVEKEPSFKIDLKQTNYGSFRLKNGDNRKATLFYPAQKYTLEDISFVLKALIEHFTLPLEILILHGSSFIQNNKAYVFSGPTGVGKSTIIKQVSPRQILSDDTVVIKKINGRFFAFTSPFDYRICPNLLPQKAPLGKIFFLKQASRTKAIKLAFVDSINRIIYNNIFSQYLKIAKISYSRSTGLPRVKVRTLAEEKIPHKLMISLYNLSISLYSQVSIEELYFTKDLQFLECL